MGPLNNKRAFFIQLECSVGYHFVTAHPLHVYDELTDIRHAVIDHNFQDVLRRLTVLFRWGVWNSFKQILASWLGIGERVPKFMWQSHAR